MFATTTCAGFFDQANSAVTTSQCPDTLTAIQCAEQFIPLAVAALPSCLDQCFPVYLAARQQADLAEAAATEELVGVCTQEWSAYLIRYFAVLLGDARGC